MTDNWFDKVAADARLKTKDIPIRLKSHDIREAYKQLEKNK